MATVREHLRSAEEFYRMGIREYEEGRRSGDLTRSREGCEKIFHAYIEAVTALIKKRGLPQPESHAERWKSLKKLKETKLVQAGDRGFLYLHQYAYYGAELGEEVETVSKEIREAIDYIAKQVG